MNHLFRFSYYHSPNLHCALPSMRCIFNAAHISFTCSVSFPFHLSLSVDDKRLKVLDQGIVFDLSGHEGSVTVENVSEETVMFKVKTTNPEKFRVSPPTGLIRPKALERITVTLVHGHTMDEASGRDKFLIMCKPLEEGANEDVVPIEKIHKDFKQTPSNEIEMHRIRCIYPKNANLDASMQGNNRGTGTLDGDLRTAFRNGVSTMRFSTMGNDLRTSPGGEVGKN